MTDSPAVIVYIIAVTVLSYFIKGNTDFGNMLVMSPLFRYRTNRLAAPADLLLRSLATGYLANHFLMFLSAIPPSSGIMYRSPLVILTRAMIMNT